MAAVAIGGGLAALLTPLAARRIGYTRWPAALLMLAGVVELTLGLPFKLQTFLPAAALLGLSAQGVKICVDTLIAQRVADDYRGRVFSLYDTLFNVIFVAAGVLTALALPENGKSTTAVTVIGLAYLSTGAVYLFARDTDPFAPVRDHPEDVAEGVASAGTARAQAVPRRAVRGRAVPGQGVPSRAVPGQAVPGQAVPSQAVPSQAVPSQAVPSQAMPSRAVAPPTDRYALRSL